VKLLSLIEAANDGIHASIALDEPPDYELLSYVDPGFRPVACMLTRLIDAGCLLRY
jgi:hypothetical protein